MKKAIFLLLSIILMLSVFTACTKGDSNDSDNNQASDKSSEQVSFTIDSHYENIDESAVRAYEKLCSAVINGEKEVKFNTSLLDDVHNLFYTSFPLFSLVESIQILPDSSGISLTYKNSDEEHKTIVSGFLNRINEIMQQCQYGKVSTDTYVFNVYTYITSNFILDSSVITISDALTDNKGYSAVLCSLFEYLVLQGGGKASHIINVYSSSMISLVQFKGEWYYFNPALDMGDDQGKSLKGFAMNNERAGNIEYTYTDYSAVAVVEDNTFDELKNSISFEIMDNKVNVTCSDNESFMLELN
ncbi:MAG: hypothetical protein K2J35_00595 [Eubacterium sp.]|nr:hypothetical protein [Eubacterium sp.]